MSRRQKGNSLKEMGERMKDFYEYNYGDKGDLYFSNYQWQQLAREALNRCEVSIINPNYQDELEYAMYEVLCEEAGFAL